jgi:thiol-disulfide isomerase/thioredoxin
MKQKSRLVGLSVAVVLCLTTTLTARADNEQSTNLDAYLGQVVLLDFWASWCGPCRRSFPWMNAMRSKYAAQGLAVVAVNLDKEPEAAEKFLQHYPAQFDILFDSSASLAHQFGVETMPTSYVLDSQGAVIYTHHGFTTKRAPQLERALVAALAQQESNP